MVPGDDAIARILRRARSKGSKRKITTSKANTSLETTVQAPKDLSATRLELSKADGIELSILPLVKLWVPNPRELYLM